MGVSNALSHDWLDEVQSHAPNLRCVYFTRAPGTKALGWTDAVLMQTMRAPVCVKFHRLLFFFFLGGPFNVYRLLPCGHVMDKDAALRHNQCAFCRNRFASAVRCLIAGGIAPNSFNIALV